MTILFHESSRSRNVGDLDFDMLVCALGYESRSIHIANALVGRYQKGLCFQFKDRNCLSFTENQKKFIQCGFDFIEWPNTEIRSMYQEVMKRELELNKGRFRLAIDVSSMTRELAAEILYCACNMGVGDEEQMEVTLLYSPAEFIEPKKVLVPVNTIGPVLPEYSGWASKPESPSYAVLGLGYEYGRAIGALDYLDSSDIWLFKPIGKDERYRARVESVNKDLVASLDASRLVDYFVSDPYETFIRLRSLSEGLLNHGRIVLVPFGPKLFNALALLLAEVLGPDVAVWRVSSTVSEEPIDRVASGEVISFSFYVTA